MTTVSNPFLATFLAEARKAADGDGRIRFKQIQKICKDHNLSIPYFFTRDDHIKSKDASGKVLDGIFTIPDDAYMEHNHGHRDYCRNKRVDAVTTPRLVVADESTEMQTLLDAGVIMPAPGTRYIIPRDATFEPFGFYDEIEMLMKSGWFYPVFITGPTGIGKTMFVEQAAARLDKDLIIINVTGTTDEDDLIGSFTMVNGTIQFRLGPIPFAMLRGIPILLDEVDFGSAGMTCLQPVLSGKSLYIKKLGLMISRMPGFNCYATGNTKGRADETGKFVHTNIMNEAMLDRFPMMFDAAFPPKESERRILSRNADQLDMQNADDFIDRLLTFANTTRKAWSDQTYDDVLSTRRLVDIVKAYAIYGNEDTAVTRLISRFPTEIKEGWWKMWEAIRPAASPHHASGFTSVKPDDDD